MRKVMIVLLALLLVGCASNNNAGLDDKTEEGNTLNEQSKNNQVDNIEEMSEESNQEVTTQESSEVDSEAETVDADESISLRNVSNALPLKEVIKATLMPGDSVEYLIEPLSDTAFIEIHSTQALKATLREVKIDDNANNSFYIGVDDILIDKHLLDGEEILFLENDHEQAITYIIALDYKSATSTSAQISDSGLKLVDFPSTFESGMSFAFTHGTIAFDSVEVFIENEDLGLSMQNGMTYLYLKGTIQNTSDEERSMMRLFRCVITDKDNDQKGDASSWLEGGDGYRILAPGESESFQKLFLLDGDRTVMQVVIESVDAEALIYELDIEDISKVAKTIESENVAMEENALAEFSNQVITYLTTLDLDAMADVSEFAFVAYGENADTVSVYIESYMWPILLDITDSIVFEQENQTTMTYGEFLTQCFENQSYTFEGVYNKDEEMPYTWLDHYKNDQYVKYSGDIYTLYLMFSDDEGSYQLIGIGII